MKVALRAIAVLALVGAIFTVVAAHRRNENLKVQRDQMLAMEVRKPGLFDVEIKIQVRGSSHQKLEVEAACCRAGKCTPGIFSYDLHGQRYNYANSVMNLRTHEAVTIPGIWCRVGQEETR